MAARNSGLNRNKEIWAMALWVERHQGTDGRCFIAEQIERNLVEGAPEGVALWMHIGRRFDELVKIKCQQ